MQLLPDHVVTGRCDDASGCIRVRVVVTERQSDLVRVTVLEGCRECEGSTLILADLS